MPHLVRWNEELGPFGLVVIGAHVQGGTAEEIKAKAQGLGIRFMITDGGGVEDSNAGGIPHCIVADPREQERSEGLALRQGVRTLQQAR